MHMHKKYKSGRWLTAAALLPLGGGMLTEVLGQGAPGDKAPAAQLRAAEDASPWRMEFRGKVGLNMSAKFTGLGAFSPQTATGAAAGVADRSYDDGFNLGDALTGGDGRTANWRYYNAGQVVGTTINMNSSTVLGDASTGNVGADPAPGFELAFTYEMGRREKRSWGFKGGLGYAMVATKDRQSLLATESRRTDSFDGSAIVIPPPDTATVSRLPNAPAASVTALFAGGATVPGLRELNANLVDFRFGPYVTFDIGKRISLTLEGGALATMISSDFKVNESATVAGRNPVLAPGVTAVQTFQGNSSETGVVGGGYLGLDCRVKLNERWDLLGGVQYQYLQDFKQSLGGREATLRLDQTVFATLGLSFKF